MKKIIMALGAAAMLTAGFTSCNKDASNASADDKAFGDSVAITLGQFYGAQSNTSFDRMKEMQPEVAAKFNKASFLKGVQQVLNADTADMAYLYGLQTGMQLFSPMVGINNELQIPVDKDLLLKAFKETFEKDSIEDFANYRMQYQNMMSLIQQKAQEREEAAIAESPEAKKNLEEGQAYAEKKVAEGFTKDESGIVYKIENPGAEPAVLPTDIVAVKYTGRDINGEVFDSNANETDIRPMRANGFVEGFTTALTKLGKGGKMTVVIPADKAYGVRGGGSIGPNQTLEFDIEIVDVNPAK